MTQSHVPPPPHSGVRDYRTSRWLWAPPGRAFAALIAFPACLGGVALVRAMLRHWPAAERRWAMVAAGTPEWASATICGVVILLLVYYSASLNLWWKYERRRRHGRCAACGYALEADSAACARSAGGWPGKKNGIA